MKESLPENLINLAISLPYPLYVVGGRVRDFVAGLHSDETDTDICAPATAEDFAARALNAGFKIDAVYKNTGSVKLSFEKDSYEFTCFRTDRYVRGTHAPEETYFTDDILTDARRRDFKCNAVYYDITAGQIVDPLNGCGDIVRGIISTVAPADKVFGEDGLRLMRLARFAAQANFTPSKECIAGAKNNCKLIRDISPERIYSELNSILHADGKYGISGAQYKGLEILKDIGVLEIILPELCEGDKMKQREDFHKYDVLEHSLKSVYYADASVRLAALLHDVGKPYCFKNTGRFVGHEDAGAEIAAKILERLKAPKKATETVVRLIKTHMYDMRCDAKENKVRKFIIKNYDIYDKLLLLKQADYSACKDDLREAPTVTKFKRIFDGMKKNNIPFTLGELKIKGNDLISLGIPAKHVGKCLSKLLNDCAAGQVNNIKEELIVYAGKVLPSFIAEPSVNGLK